MSSVKKFRILKFKSKKPPILSVKGISKSINKIPILKNINFDINDNLYKTLGGGIKKENVKSSNFNHSFELLKKVFNNENEIINLLEKINSDIFIESFYYKFSFLTLF